MAPKLAHHWYTIHNAANTAARNAAIKTATRVGMTRADAAKAAGISPSTVGKIISA